jgi:ubiquinone/menaquinone biosynthesis C-methylase UbiE
MSKEELPFEDNSVYLFYSEHTFEHITDDACKHVFAELFRSLKAGGAVRIVVPDIYLAYIAYANQNDIFFNSLFLREEKTREEKFLEYFATYLKDKVDIEEVKNNFENLEKSEFLDYYTQQIDPMTQRKYTGYHINWFDYGKLKKMLEEAGFEDVCRSASQGSKFNEMRGKEFDTRPSWSLHVEAIK